MEFSANRKRMEWVCFVSFISILGDFFWQEWEKKIPANALLAWFLGF